MTGKGERVVLIVLDGVGIGALPDASLYGDSGANTLLHVAEACGGLSLPHLQQMGLGNLCPIPGLAAVTKPTADYARMAERAAGKDTPTGHWEICGVIQQEPFATFPQGFPPEVIAAFSQATGLIPLGNVVASGTEIIRSLGEEHCRTGRPIVYTSVDSVFQIAAHEEVIPPEDLYAICRTARSVFDRYRIGRVIARPFIGRDAASFVRTAGRHDFAMPPTGPTMLDDLCEQGWPVHAIGKISDIFAGRGITSTDPTVDNHDGMARILQELDRIPSGLVFANLVDFDMLFGHRRDSAGFGRALVEFDAWLPILWQKLLHGDWLIITADHGCDPTTPGTDHSREYVPLLCQRKGFVGGRDLGVRSTFADLGATLATIFGVSPRGGESLYVTVSAPSAL